MASAMNVAVEINTIEAVAIDVIDEIYVAVAIDVVASHSHTSQSLTSRSRSDVMQAEGGDEWPLWCDASREGVSCTNHLVV